jgi:hypothetical protein
MTESLADATMPVEIGLTAAIVATPEDRPAILVARDRSPGGPAALPSGPFDPLAHRTLESGLRTWVQEQTGVPLGYVEQLYTFGDRGRNARAGDRDPHVVSVGYLALTRIPERASSAAADAGFRAWYDFLPWEDFRAGRSVLLDAAILPRLEQWTERGPTHGATGLPRRERLRFLFGLDGAPFDEEKVLERYELMYEAGLVEEAKRDGREAAALWDRLPVLGEAMRFDHRRILATAIGRLRAKLKYRPVIFELMPETFTLTELQRVVEAIAGRHLHKQNFRRLVETSLVVEPTGEVTPHTGGRPAALHRFRREVLQERPAPGLRFGGR